MCARLDSNQGPAVYKTAALPTELQAQKRSSTILHHVQKSPKSDVKIAPGLPGAILEQSLFIALDLAFVGRPEFVYLAEGKVDAGDVDAFFHDILLNGIADLAFVFAVA
jgi:hypothetical protein